MNVNNTNNRSSAISFKGSSMSNKSRSLANKVDRASRQNRVSNSKVNLEDINLELESMMTGPRGRHFIMDPS